MTKTVFHRLLAQVLPDPGTDHLYQASLTEDWLQGRAGFGGLMAALAVTALRQHVGVQRPLRALMTSFVGPAGAGDLRIECNTLRSGKSVTWAEARIVQGEQVCTTFSACFGDGRESRIQVQAPERPPAKAPEDAAAFPYMPGVTPAFIQHFEMRWAIGEFPVSGSDSAEAGVWLRFRDGDDFGEAHVVALMDVLPPAVLQMFSEMRPVSSLSWHLELLDALDGADARDGDGWWFFHVDAHGAADGYSQQHATLYTPAGRAIAMSQQAIAVFA